jgi:GTP-binding protein
LLRSGQYCLRSLFQAIAGRSNVGKSTLLNALLYGNRPSVVMDASPALMARSNRRRMPSAPAKLPRGLKAVTSAKPGETRRLTFYQLSARLVQKTTTPTNTTLPSSSTNSNSASLLSPSGENNNNNSSSSSSSKKLSLMLVDLPGYGFAYASPEQAEQWQSLMESYILRRGKSLKRVLLLLDARHGMKKSDFDFLESLQTALYATHEDDTDASRIQQVREWASYFKGNKVTQSFINVHCTIDSL